MTVRFLSDVLWLCTNGIAQCPLWTDTIFLCESVLAADATSRTALLTWVRTVRISLWELPHTFNAVCIGPSALKGPYDSVGFPVGCKSACVAGLGDPCRAFPHRVAHCH